MDIRTQQKMILEYCRAHGSITVREASDKLRINSPTKRLSEIRHSPKYKVSTDTIREYDDDGKLKNHYSRYYIEEVNHAM